MDRHIIDNQHLIERYLAGQLDAAQSAEFEAYYARHPEVVRDIERLLRLKEGLAVLEERGELDAIVRRRDYWRPALGLAAGIAVLVVGVWLWIGHTTIAPVVSTIAALTDQSGEPLHVASTHMLVKIRGPAVVVGIQLPTKRSAIELQMIPSSRPDSGGFRVLLGQLDAADAIAPLGETRALANSADGFVTAYLDSAQLSRGRYAIELQPERPAEPGAPSDRFVIEVR
jgi:hypothetical protein